MGKHFAIWHLYQVVSLADRTEQQTDCRRIMRQTLAFIFVLFLNVVFLKEQILHILYLLLVGTANNKCCLCDSVRRKYRTRSAHTCGTVYGLAHKLPINKSQWLEDGANWGLRSWHIVMLLYWLQSHKLKTNSRWEAIPISFNCVICIIRTQGNGLKWW